MYFKYNTTEANETLSFSHFIRLKSYSLQVNGKILDFIGKANLGFLETGTFSESILSLFFGFLQTDRQFLSVYYKG